MLIMKILVDDKKCNTVSAFDESKKVKLMEQKNFDSVLKGCVHDAPSYMKFIFHTHAPDVGDANKYLE